MPASASPSETLVTTPLTETSSETGFTVTPALARASWAYLPAGTSGAASTTLRSLRARSASPVMCLGLPGSTAMMSLLPANVLRRAGQAPRTVHVRRVGRGEHVRRRALLQLRHQVVAAGEVEGDLHVRMGGGEVRRPAVVKASVSEAAAKTLSSRRPLAGRCRCRRRRRRRRARASASETARARERRHRLCGGGRAPARVGTVMSLAPFQARGGPGVSAPGPRRRPHIAAPRSVRGTAQRP